MSTHHSLDHAAAEPNYGTGKKDLRTYVIGLLWCVALTLIPFAAVMYRTFSFSLTMTILLISAVIQFFVQVVCFLRLNTQTEAGKYNVVTFVFTFLVVFILIGGSVWIMVNLNYNMMH